jgi:hypothetical protein
MASRAMNPALESDLTRARKLRYYIDECLLAIKFDETRKPEHLIKMKSSMERFLGALDRLEKET